jgi:nicotinate-nucleotide adenylyltransferase
MTADERIGILGGTFDPPHIGHLWLAALAADSLRLSRVLFMPAARPPHKAGRPLSSAKDRLALTRAAIDADPRFELCELELERPGPSYTVDSVAALLERYPSPQRLILLMASDSLSEIETWRDPERLLSLVELGVGPRSGHWPVERGALTARFGAAADRIHLIDGPALEISSSELRRRVAAGQTIRYLVPRAVEALIVERALYRNHETRSTHPG